jgi:hypothetical protein
MSDDILRAGPTRGEEAVSGLLSLGAAGAHLRVPLSAAAWARAEKDVFGVVPPVDFAELDWMRDAAALVMAVLGADVFDLDMLLALVAWRVPSQP